MAKFSVIVWAFYSSKRRTFSGIVAQTSCLLLVNSLQRIWYMYIIGHVSSRLADSGNCQRMVPLPLSSRKNGYRKNDYTLDYPDFIEPLFSHSHSPTTPTPTHTQMENGLLENVVLLLVFCNQVIRTNQIRMEQQHFDRDVSLEMDQFLKGDSKCNLFRKLVRKFKTIFMIKINSYYIKKIL